MVLYHRTSFGIAEHPNRSADRAAAARERIRLFLDARPGLAGVVLTGPGAVAWATGGATPAVDRTAALDLIWVVATASGTALVTTQVEGPRIRAELLPVLPGVRDVAEVPWYEPQAFAEAAAELAGAPAASLASDGHPAFGCDASDDLIALRLALSDAEQADLRDLGRDAAAALESAVGSWQPGERDLDVQARCAAGLEAAGAEPVCLIVGGDERVERFRHPLAAGTAVRRLLMAVVVARRSGLHVAATRFATAGKPPAELARLRGRVLQIERQVLAASRPPATYGAALSALARAYEAAGAPGGWAGHYQGGPIGFAQREFEVAPGQAGSRWLAEQITPGHAVAWNPSLPGGAKAEDTYLVTGQDRPERITVTPDWPAEPGDDLARPAALEAA